MIKTLEPIAAKKAAKKQKRKDKKKAKAVATKVNNAKFLTKLNRPNLNASRNRALNNLGVKRNTPTNQRLMGGSSIPADVRKVAKMIVAPFQNEPVRYSTEYTTEPSSLANPWDVFDALTSTDTNPQTLLPTTDYVIFVFRDPLRSTVAFDANNGLVLAKYQMSIYDEFSEVYTFDAVFNNALGDTTRTDVDSNYYQSTNPGGYAPHGNFWYPGKDNVGNESGEFYWYDLNTELSLGVQINQLTGVGAYFNMDLDKWDNGKIHPAALNATASVSSTQVMTIGESGYYRLRVCFTNTQVPGDNVNLTVDWDNHKEAVWAHQCMPFFDENILSVEDPRTLGVSVLATNVSADLDASGKVVGVQLKRDQAWFDNTSFDFLTKKSNAEASLPAKTGIYGFLRPEDDDCFKMSSSYEIEQGIVARSGYPLRPESEYLCVALSIINPNGRDFRITTAYAVDYSTSDTWRPTGKQRPAPGIFAKAVFSTNQFKQWHENPLHFGDIFDFVKKVAGGVSKYGNKAVGLANYVSGMFD